MTEVEEGSPVVTTTAEIVAKTIAGIPLIGQAHRTLCNAGYQVILAANRIIIDGEIEATLHGGDGVSWWQVYALDGTPPVWTVGTVGTELHSWMGCVE